MNERDIKPTVYFAQNIRLHQLAPTITCA